MVTSLTLRKFPCNSEPARSIWDKSRCQRTRKEFRSGRKRTQEGVVIFDCKHGSRGRTKTVALTLFGRNTFDIAAQ